MISKGFKEPIKRITASAYNSAAFNEEDNLYFWGSSTDHKLGLGKDIGSVEAPFRTDWRAEKVGFYTENGKPAIRYQLNNVSDSKYK